MPTVLAPLSLMLLVGPLRSGLTYRRFVHLLLGAVLLLPYVALVGLFVLSVRAGGLDPVSLVLLIGAAVVVGIGVALVPGVRSLEITAARGLLGARLTDPDPGTVDAWSARWRAMVWLVVNLVVGGVAALLTLSVVPLTFGFVLAPWLAFAGFPTGLAAAWAPPVGLLLPVLLLHLVRAAGAGLARLAPLLLGPSAAERLAVDLATAHRTSQAMAHRNRLARELHDSVGHALTVTTLQAGAAARVLDTDPDFVATALDAIADAGRRALDELDHVLGLLRDGAEDGDEPARAPQPDLRDLDALLAGTRATGVALDAGTDGDLAAVPAAVSREAYRIVQEALTNALRHAGPVPVDVRVVVSADGVELAVCNPRRDHNSAAAKPRLAGGSGVVGRGERVAVLGGELRAGPDGGLWRVVARIPFTP